jgi:hypothetical protein
MSLCLLVGVLQVQEYAVISIALKRGQKYFSSVEQTHHSSCKHVLCELSGDTTPGDVTGDNMSGCISGRMSALDDCTGSATISDAMDTRFTSAVGHPVLAEDLLKQWISQDLQLEESKGKGVSAGVFLSTF